MVGVYTMPTLLHKSNIDETRKPKQFTNNIKGPDTMANLVWANTCISGYVTQYSAGIFIRSTQAQHAGLCIFAPQLARIHWHAIGTK